MEIQKFCVGPEARIMDSIKVLDQMAKKIVLVVEEERLVGVVTDGDIRRWILQNGSLESSVKYIMNPRPVVIGEAERHKAEQVFVHRQIEAIPVVDSLGKVVDLIFWNDQFQERKRPLLEDIKAPVVIMAGGKGTRLYPYTKVLPKPLIPIGEKTILEHIIDRFQGFGCRDFYLTLNYKKNMIKAYLEEKKEEVNLHFVEEEKFLGTGGSLALLKGELTETFILSNCDILVEADYADIIRYHKKNGYKITMVTSLKNYTIPYGVIKVADGGSIAEIIEKPEYNFQINTGFYVLEPEILDEIPEDEFYHITQLINAYVERGERVGAYPITSNAWLDMGEIKEMEAMINRLKIEVD